jgi:hypothetical protein
MTERDDLPRRPASRFSARGFGIALLVLTPLIWFYGHIQSQTGWGTWNTAQLTVNWALTASLITTGVLLLAYAGRTRISGWVIAAALVLNIGLLAVWIVGWSHWCSHCGTP